MLDSLYTTLFRPSEAPVAPSMGVAWGIWFLLSLLEAMNLAGALALGPGGMVGLFVLVFGLNVMAWFWLSASSNLLAQLLGGKGSGTSTMTAIAQAYWPMILQAPVTAAAPWLGPLAPLLNVAIVIWTYVGVVRALAQVHALSAGRAAVVFIGSGAAIVLGVLALLLTPLISLFLAVA